MRSISRRQLFFPKTCLTKPISDSRLEGLAQRILTEGLNYPLIVKAGSDDSYTLLAGGRRAKALLLLTERMEAVSCDGVKMPADCIPVILLSDIELSDDADIIKEADTEGNLTWQQKVAAIAELHAHRCREENFAGREHSFKAMAAEIKGDGVAASKTEVEYLLHAVILASHLGSSEIAHAGSLSDAYTVLLRNAAALMAASRAGSRPEASVDPMNDLSQSVSSRLKQERELGLRDRRYVPVPGFPKVRVSTGDNGAEASYFSNRFPEHLRFFANSLDDHGSCSRARCHQREDFWGIQMGSMFSGLVHAMGLCFSQEDLIASPATGLPDHLAALPTDDIPNFLCALFYLILIDQVMYTHHQSAYLNFCALTRYPKMDITIGWSRPMIMANPYTIFQNKMFEQRGIKTFPFEAWAKFISTDLPAFFAKNPSVPVTWNEIRQSMLSDHDCFLGIYGTTLRRHLATP